MGKFKNIIRMPSAGEQGVAVLAAGDYPAGEVARALLHNADKVVCCDGAAAEFISLGGKPFAIVGDCDSLNDSLRERYSALLHCDADQQTNDLTKAVNFCRSEGLNAVTILGGTGKREDHTLGNISLLADYAATGMTVRMVTDRGVFDPITEDATFESFSGQQVSVFALSPQTRLTTLGLRYPLQGATLSGWWAGTLNESLDDEFALQTNGPLLVYRLFA